jgi:hypothetical protein
VLDELEPRQNFTGNDEAHFTRVLTKLWNGWYANDAKVIVTGNFRDKAEFCAWGMHRTSSRRSANTCVHPPSETITARSPR